MQTKSNGFLATKNPGNVLGSTYGPFAILHILQIFPKLLASENIVLQ